MPKNHETKTNIDVVLKLLMNTVNLVTEESWV